MLCCLLVLTGCRSAADDRVSEHEPLAVICSSPRPQLCTREYRPVCARLDDGREATRANACEACATDEVIGYRDGSCEADPSGTPRTAPVL
jgi:hypothetical protein